MTDFDSAVRNAFLRAEEAKKRNQEAVERFRNNNTKDFNLPNSNKEVRLDASSWINPKVHTDIPNYGGVEPTGMADNPEQYKPTYGDRNPKTQVVREAVNGFSNFLTTGAANAVGAYTLASDVMGDGLGLGIKTVGSLLPDSDNPYISGAKNALVDAGDSILGATHQTGATSVSGYIKNMIEHHQTEAMNAREKIFNVSGANAWIEQSRPSYVQALNRDLAEIDKNPDLSEGEKFAKSLQIYLDNPDFSGRASSVVGIQTALEALATVATGGFLRLSKEANVALANLAPAALHFLDERYTKTGKITVEDLNAAGLVGGFAGVTGKVAGRFMPVDIERSAADVVGNMARGNLSEVAAISGKQLMQTMSVGGVEEGIQGGSETLAHNYLDGKPLHKGIGASTAHNLVLGAGASGFHTAPHAASEITNSTIQTVTPMVKKAVNAAKNLTASEATKQTRKYESTINSSLESLATLDDKATDEDYSTYSKHIHRTLNELNKHINNLQTQVQELEDPKQKAKAQKDLDIATRTRSQLLDKKDAFFEQKGQYKTADEAVDSAIAKINALRLKLHTTDISSPKLKDYNISGSDTAGTYTAKGGQVSTGAVIRMGNYEFKDGKQSNAHDVGRGSGNHIDIHVVGKKDVNPAQYADRFIVAEGKYQGKSLGELLQSGQYVPSAGQAFGAERNGYSHSGIDFDARIGGGVYINPQYKVKNITQHHDPKGYGHYIKVHFDDGVSIGLGHLGEQNVQAFMQAYQQGGGKGTGTNIATGKITNKYPQHRELNLAPTQYDGLMREIYTKYGYTLEEQKILRAQLAQESGFDPNAESTQGAKGIAQFVKGTAKNYGVNVNDVASSIDGQARLMRDLLKKSGGNWEMALAFYNAGAGKTDATTRFNKIKNYPETSKYYQNILYHAGYGESSANYANPIQTQLEPTGVGEYGNSDHIKKLMEQAEQALKTGETEQTAQDKAQQANQTEQSEQTEQTEQAGDEQAPKKSLLQTLSQWIHYSKQMNDEHIQKLLEAGAMTPEQAEKLRVLNTTAQIVNEHKDSNTVKSEIYYGKEGRTTEESNRGLVEYQDRLHTAVHADDLSSLTGIAEDLYKWEESATSKAKKVNQAYQMFVDTQATYTVARDAQTQEWQIFEGKPFNEQERRAYGAVVVNANSKNFAKQLLKESAHIQQVANAYHAVLEGTEGNAVRKLNPEDLIDFNSINVKPVQVNAHNPTQNVQHSSTFNTGFAGFNNTSSVPPVSARAGNKSEDLSTAYSGTPAKTDVNPQITNRHERVEDFINAHGNDAQQVWLGRGVNSKGDITSISSFIYNSTRKDLKTDMYVSTGNNVLNEVGGVKTGVFGMSSNVIDGTKKTRIKPSTYHIVHDGSKEGASSAQIESANRFMDMMRLAVENNSNFANLLIGMANSPQLQLHGSTRIGDGFNEATVMTQVLPVVKQAVQGIKAPNIQQKKVVEALGKMGTLMSDGKFHQEVSRQLNLDTAEIGVRQLKYDTAVHTKQSLSTYQVGTQEQVQEQGQNISSQDLDSSDIGSQDDSTQNVGEQGADEQGTDKQDANEQQVSDHYSAIEATQRSNAVTKPPKALGMKALNQQVQDEQAQEQVQETRNPVESIMDKVVAAREAIEALNPVQLKSSTHKTTEQADTHHAELQGVIETLDKYLPDMKVLVQSSEAIHAEKEQGTSHDDDVIRITSDGLKAHEQLASGMMKQAVGKVANELDGLIDEDAEAYTRAYESLKDNKVLKTLDPEQRQKVERTAKLIEIREGLKAASRIVASHLRTNEQIPTELKTKVLNVINNPSDMMHYGLMDKEVKTLFKSIQMDKSRGKLGSVYQSIKNAISKYLGFSAKQHTVFDKVLDSFSKSVELTVSDGAGVFIKSETAKLNVFAQKVDIHEEDSKALRPYKEVISETKNVLATYFKQEQSKQKPLSSMIDFVSNLMLNPVKAAQALGLDAPTDKQLAQIRDFGLFHAEFKSHIEQVAIKKNAGYEYTSMASYLIDEHGEVQESVLSAISHVAYDFIIANGNHLRHTDDEIKQLLGLYEEQDRDAVRVTPELRKVYEYRGFVYDIQAQKLGERVAKTLNIKANELGSMELDSRLYSALGSWALSAMQSADLVHVTQISTQEHLNNMAQINPNMAEQTAIKASEHGKTRFVSVSNLKGEKVNPRLQEIITTNKGTAGYLASVFGGGSALRMPLTKPPKQGKVKRSIKKTKAQVSDVQAKLVDKAQQEPMVVNEEFNHIINTLYEQHEDALLMMLGAKIPDEKLHAAHATKRGGIQGKADGVMRDLTSAINFIDGLGTDAQGKRKYWDTMFMAGNTRMHLNSNVMNIQSSKLHRAWADLDSYENHIDLKQGNTLSALLDKLGSKGRDATVEDFSKDELSLMMFIKALGENAEGSKSFIENAIKNDIQLSQLFKEGFTVDKLPSHVFVPIFLEYLSTPVISEGVQAIQKVLSNEQLNTKQMQAIQSAVADMGMGGQSLRALMEWARYLSHEQHDKGVFKTKLSLSSDGINNGVMLAHVNNGTADSVMLLRTGLFSKESGYQSYQDARHDPNIGDYYTAFKDMVVDNLTKKVNSLKMTIADLQQKGEDASAKINELNTFEQIQGLFKTLSERKAAKDVLVPVNYGSGETATKLSVYHRFLDDIYEAFTQIANEADVDTITPEQVEDIFIKDVVPLIQSLNILTGKNPNTAIELVYAEEGSKSLLIDKVVDVSQLKEVVFNKKDEAALLDAFMDTVGDLIWKSLIEYEGDFLRANKRNINMLSASASLYVAEYEILHEQALKQKEQDLINKYLDQGLDEATATKYGKNELEFVGLSYAEIAQIESQLDTLLPRVHNASSKIGNEKAAKTHLVTTQSQAVSGNSELTQNNFFMMNDKGVLQSTIATSASKKLVLESAGRLANSIQTQSQDARISSLTMASSDTVFSNIHDANASGTGNHVQMAQLQNKSAYKTMTGYSAQVESLNTLMDTLNTSYDRITQRGENPYKNKSFIEALAVAHTYVNEVEAGDAVRQKRLLSLDNLHQYGGEFGSYKISVSDVLAAKEIFKEINTAIDTISGVISDYVSKFNDKEFSEYQADYPKADSPSQAQVYTLIGYGKDDINTMWQKLAKDYGFGGVSKVTTDHKNLTAAQKANARLALMKNKSFKRLDKDRRNDRKKMFEYNKQLNLHYAVDISDAVFINQGLEYDEYTGQQKLGYTASNIAYMAKQADKVVYVSNEEGSWHKRSPIDNQWYEVGMPKLSKNPFIYSESSDDSAIEQLMQYSYQHEQSTQGGTKTAQKVKGFKDLEIEQQENSKSVHTTKIFNTKDIKKAINARQKTEPVKALFDAYMGVVEKHYPNLTLNFVKEGGFNAYYQNSQITVNEQMWESLADNDKVRLINHELAHVVTLKGLEYTQHPAVKDLHKMYEYLKTTYTKGTHPALDAVFYPTNASGDVISDARVGVAEMVAYGTENSAVQDYIKENLKLREAGVKPKERLGVLSQFYAAVHSLLSKLGFINSYQTFVANVNEVIELGTDIKTEGQTNADITTAQNTTLNEEPVSSSDKDSKYSQEYDDKLTLTQLYQSIKDNDISDEHDRHLSSLMDKIYTTEYESFVIDEEVATRLYAGNEYVKAPSGLFGLSVKESHAYSALATSIEHLLTHHNDNQVAIEVHEVVSQLIEHFDSVEKLFSNYDSMTQLQKQIADTQFKSLFGDLTTNPVKSTAHIISTLMVSEQFKEALNIPVKLSKAPDSTTWFDKAMRILHKVFNFLREKAIYDKNTDSTVLEQLMIKLAKIDGNVRLDKKNMVDTAYHWAYTQPVKYIGKGINKAVDTALDGVQKIAPTKVVKNVASVAVNLRNPDTQAQTKQSLVDTLNDISNKLYDNDFKELTAVFEELRGQYDVSSKLMETMIRYNNKAQSLRANIKERTAEVLSGTFNNSLDIKQKEAITRTLLMTDAQSLLDYHADEKRVLQLVLDKSVRNSRKAELEKELLRLVPEQHIRYGMIYQMKDLSMYMVKEVALPDLRKSTEMIAVSSATPWAKPFEAMDKEIFHVVDELTTLYALDKVDKSHMNKLTGIVNDHAQAVIQVLNVQKDNVLKSKEEFKDNPLNYTKGYTASLYDPRVDVKAVLLEEIDEYIAKGYELVSEKALPQDALDNSEPRYLVRNTNYPATRRVSGAVDLLDSHHKGTQVTHYKQDGNEVARISKQNLQRFLARIQTDPTNYEPDESSSGALIPVVGTDGLIIHHQYEMTGVVRDSLLKRDLSFDNLMATQMASLEVNPQIKGLQKSLAKQLVAIAKDDAIGFHKKPNDYIALSSRSQDPQIQEILQLMPYELKSELEAGFGKGKPILIPKRSVNLIFGFKKWSVSEWFDKATHERNAYQKIVTELYTNIYGNQARNKAHEHQMVWEWFAKQAARSIVVRGISVLVGNIKANLLLLALHGLSPAQMAKDITYAWREGQRYSKWEKERLGLLVELSAHVNNPTKIKQIQNQIKKLEYLMKSSGMHQFMQEGLVSTVVMGVDTTSETKIFKSPFEQKVDDLVNKVPTTMRNIGKWAVLAEDTKPYQFLSQATQFSDAAAKYALTRHVQKQAIKAGVPKDEAFRQGFAMAQEAFINYDLPTGRKVQLLNDLAIYNFTKFTFRFPIHLLRTLNKDTGHALLQHYMVEHYLSTSGVLDPLVPVPHMGWGVGTMISGVEELPVSKLFF